MENRTKRLTNNTAILGVGTTFSKAIMFLLAPLLTRWVSQDSFGNYDLIITYISLLVPLLTLSIGEGVFRFVLEKKNDVSRREIVSTAIMIDVASFLVGALILILISLFVPVLHETIFVFIPLLVVQAFYEFNLMLARGLGRIKDYTISNVIFAFVLMVSCFAIVNLLHGELTGILSSYLIGYFIASSYLVARLKTFKFISGKNINMRVGKQLIKYSAPLIPNSVAWWIVNVSDRTIVSIVLGASSNAILAVANKIPNICQTIFGVFHISWQESASESLNDKDRDAFYSNIMNNIFQIMSSICIVVVGFNFLIFKALFPDNYVEASFISPILIAAIIFSIMSQFYGGIYIAQKKSIANGLTTTIAAVINVIVHISLIWSIGIYAAPISTIVSYVALFLIRHFDVTKRRKMHLKYNKNSAIMLVLVVYFVATAYLNNTVFSCVNAILALICFGAVNRNRIKKLIRRNK